MDTDGNLRYTFNLNTKFPEDDIINAINDMLSDLYTKKQYDSSVFNVVDVLKAVNHIMNREYVVDYDINKDNKLDIIDVTSIVAKIIEL